MRGTCTTDQRQRSVLYLQFICNNKKTLMSIHIEITRQEERRIRSLSVGASYLNARVCPFTHKAGRLFILPVYSTYGREDANPAPFPQPIPNLLVCAESLAVYHSSVSSASKIKRRCPAWADRERPIGWQKKKKYSWEHSALKAMLISPKCNYDCKHGMLLNNF